MTMLPFGEVAPMKRRVLAYVVDALIAAGLCIVLTVIATVIAVAAGPDGMLGALAIALPVVSLVMVAWLLVYTAMQGGAGSIGMRTQGIRLARAEDGAPLGFVRALLRNLVFWLTASIVVGYFTPLFDGTGRYQGWHDMAGRALMLDARSEAPASAPAPPPGTTAMPIPTSAAAPDALMPPRPSLSGAAPAPASPDAWQPAAPMPPAPAFPEVGVPQSPAPAFPTASAPTTVSPEFPDETVVSPASVVAPQPVAPTAPAESMIAFVPGVTRDSAPERPTPPTPPVADQRATPATPVRPEPEPEPEPEPVPDLDDIEDTRISIPGHRLVFTWDDGTKVNVSRRTVFGRNPAQEDGAVVAPVRDETLSLSKTHFEAAAEVSGGWVMDRNSTNGLTIVRDGVRIVCAPGERVRVRLGDVIEIGDRVVTIGGYV